MVDAVHDDVGCALVLCAVDEVPHEALPRVLRWALEIWGRGVDDAPLAAIHDLGFALLRGRAVRLCGGRERFAMPGIDDDTRALVRRERLVWEERIVAPALRDPALMQAAIVIAGAPGGPGIGEDDLVIHALLLLLPRLLAGLAAPLPRHVPGGLRPLIDAPRDIAGGAPDAAADDDDAGEAPGDDDVGAATRPGGGRQRLRLTAGITAVALRDAALDLGELARARPVDAPPPLLLADELWELSRLDLIPSEAMRLALRTVHRTMDGIGPVSPAVIARLRDRRQDVIVDDVAADTFPAGGFDAMSTRGVLENLVRSEVGYVGVGAEDDPRAPDLFDVRFVEGELLYYTRDESPLLERRRQLVVVIEEVERLRHKLRELPSQTIVLVEAVVLQAFVDLQVAFGPHVVSAAIAVSGDDAAAVAEERGLLQTSLHADISHRRAAIVEASAAPLTGRVTFSPRPPPGRSPAGRRQTLWVRVGGARWELSSGTETSSIDPAGDLRQLIDRLLAMA